MERRRGRGRPTVGGEDELRVQQSVTVGVGRRRHRLRHEALQTLLRDSDQLRQHHLVDEDDELRQTTATTNSAKLEITSSGGRGR